MAVLISVMALLAGSASARPEAGAHFCRPKGTAVNFRAADGLRLHGHRFGRGTTAVVFAHEFGGSSCQWASFARTLSRSGYLSLAFDLRGFGKSQRPRRGASSRLAADVIAAAKKSRSLGAKKV